MLELPPQVNTALALLNGAGFEAFLVGGAVRDYARGHDPAQDWDITTNARPEQVKAVFSSHRLIETGLQHGTVTVLLDHMPLEITTYRVDGAYSDHRRPDAVHFTGSLREDLARRDFTMNALAYHPAVGLVDLVGGQADLAQGLIRCVGDPDRRFQEDGLRMLRALRFSATLELTIESHTGAAIHRNRALLDHIAAERVQVELTKLLCGARPAEVLRDFADVIAVPLPELVPLFGFDQRNPHHDKDVWEHTLAVVTNSPPDPVLRWAALLHDVGKPACFSLDTEGVGHFYGHAATSAALAEDILTRLKFDNGSKTRILQLVRHHDAPLAADPKAVKRLLNRHGPETVRQLIALHRADTLGQAALCLPRLATLDQVSALAEALLQEEACFSLRDLAVNGRDLLALGLRGAAIGQALQLCLEAVMDEQVPNARGPLLALIQQHTPALCQEPPTSI